MQRGKKASRFLAICVKTLGDIRIGADIRKVSPHFGHHRRYNHQEAFVEVIHPADDATQFVSVDFGQDQVEKYDVRVLSASRLSAQTPSSAMSTSCPATSSWHARYLRKTRSSSIRRISILSPGAFRSPFPNERFDRQACRVDPVKSPPDDAIGLRVQGARLVQLAELRSGITEDTAHDLIEKSRLKKSRSSERKI
jgi:hypothetical protein